MKCDQHCQSWGFQSWSNNNLMNRSLIFIFTFIFTKSDLVTGTQSQHQAAPVYAVQPMQLPFVSCRGSCWALVAVMALCAVLTSPALSAGSVKEAPGAVSSATLSTRSWPSAPKTHCRYSTVVYKSSISKVFDTRQTGCIVKNKKTCTNVDRFERIINLKVNVMIQRPSPYSTAATESLLTDPQYEAHYFHIAAGR